VNPIDAIAGDFTGTALAVNAVMQQAMGATRKTRWGRN
jgi:hypothetical protein